MSTTGRRDRIAAVVGGVVRQAVVDAGARGVVLLDDRSAESTLTYEFCARALGAERVLLADGQELTNALRERLHLGPGGVGDAASVPEWAAEEARRLAARLLAAGEAGPLLPVSPATKTVLLLGRSAPPEPLLPLGDLYATDIAGLAGVFTLPPPLRALADAAGGVAALDASLRAYFDERRPLDEALERLPATAREAVAAAIAAARFARRHMGIVPKLGARTLAIDLFA